MPGWNHVVPSTSSTSILGIGLAILTLCGCASSITINGTSRPISRSGDDVRNCAFILRNVRRAVVDEGVGDAEAWRVPGYPYLRTNRFLAYVGQRFQNRPSGSAFTAWVKRLRALDAEALRLEVKNLPAHALARLGHRVFGASLSDVEISRIANACANRLVPVRLIDVKERLALVRAAHVPDSYSDAARFLGFFPLTSIPMRMGWENWKQENLSTFQQPPGDLAIKGQLMSYIASTQKSNLRANEVKKLVERSRDPLLGIPEPQGQDLEALFATFAPIWQVDTTGAHDRIGHPAWHANGKQVTVDDARPAVFRRISHTVIDGQVLLQLNYSVWFKARPESAALDLLAGNLDGVIWRVTIGLDGRPLIYDSIHACGCYHLLFPLARQRHRTAPSSGQDLKERPAILHTAPAWSPGSHTLLRLAARSHYLVNVASVRRAFSGGSTKRYQMIDARKLRSIPLPNEGRRSLFRHDGIVAGTGRLERFLLWPSGVKNPGAMRQWGNHATAFVDRRHFDDPNLFTIIFGN